MPPELFDQFLDFLTKAEALEAFKLSLSMDSQQMDRYNTNIF